MEDDEEEKEKKVTFIEDDENVEDIDLETFGKKKKKKKKREGMDLEDLKVSCLFISRESGSLSKSFNILIHFVLQGI